MKFVRLVLVLLAALLCSSLAFAQIPIDQVTVLGSDPAVLRWPVTSKLTELALGGGKIRVVHSKKDSWPSINIGTAEAPADQNGTIWVFFKIGGRWYATGGERLRPGQTEKALTVPSDIGPGWLYDSGRWGVMANYVPAPGDPVGFMVSSGSTRSDNRGLVNERSQIVEIAWGGNAGGSWPPFRWQEGDPSGPTPSTPTTPVEPPQTSGLSAQVQALSDAVAAGRQALEELRAWVSERLAEQQAFSEGASRSIEEHRSQLEDLKARAAVLEARPVWTGCFAGINLGVTKIATSCGLKQ